jgi:hypothetical protein
MITVFQTKYHGPTDYNGARIKVTNMRTGKSRWHHWDYSVNAGRDQHEHAVRESTVAALGEVALGGETERGYIFVTGTWEKL